MAESELYTVEDFEELEKEKGKEKDKDQDDLEGSDDSGDDKDDDKKDKESEEGKSTDDDKTPRFGADAGALSNMTMKEAADAFAQLSAGAQGLAARARETLVPDEPKPPEPLVTDDLLDAATIQSKLDAMVEAKIAPLKAQVTKTNAAAVYQNAVAQSEVLSMYKPEVDAYAQQITLEQAANPATWQAVENHLFRTRGAQIQAARTKVKPTPALTETGKSSEESGKSGDKIKLSSAQKFAADQLGVSHKDYAALMPAFGE